MKTIIFVILTTIASVLTIQAQDGAIRIQRTVKPTTSVVTKQNTGVTQKAVTNAPTSVLVPMVNQFSEAAVEAAVRLTIQNMDLKVLMKQSADKIFNDLVAHSEPSKLEVLKNNIYVGQSKLDYKGNPAEWCGYTVWYGLQYANANSTLKQFFEGVGGINNFVNYQHDGINNKDLKFKVTNTGDKIDLKSFHTKLGCLRKSFTVADVIANRETPQAGDIVLLDNGGGPEANHIQMVYSYNSISTNLIIIEGNGTGFVKRKTAVRADDKVPSNPIKNDGLTRIARLMFVRLELEGAKLPGTYDWNDPTEYPTHVGVSAYNLTAHQVPPRDANAPLKIVKFVRPSKMDFIPTVLNQGILYQSPYHQIAF